MIENRSRRCCVSVLANLRPGWVVWGREVSWGMGGGRDDRVGMWVQLPSERKGRFGSRGVECWSIAGLEAG